jgi:hypothetical protein
MISSDWGRFCSSSQVVALLALLLGPATTIDAGEQAKKQTEFGTAVKVGIALAKYHDTCIMFRAFFVSHDFFVGLRREKPPNDSAFKKGANSYRTFPQQFFVDVEATAVGCSGNGLPRDFGEGLLSNATFELSWKIESEVHPIEILSTQVRHTTYHLRWDYFLEISGADLPLTAELTIVITLRNGAVRSQFLAGLK